MQHSNNLVTAGLWFIVAIVSSFVLTLLKSIGTEWINRPGFIRAIGLLAFLIAFIVMPACFALFSLFGKPLILHKKAANK